MTRTRVSALVTTAVAANFALVLWHLFLLPRVYPPGPSFNVPTLAAGVGIGSLLGVLLLWTRLRRVAGWLLMALLAVGLVTGGSEHFIVPGPFNVFTVMPSGWTAQFDASAVLLAIIEFVGIWLAFGVARARSQAT